MNVFTSTRSETRELLLQAAREIALEIKAAGDEIEKERRVPPRLVAKLLDSGIWRMPFPPYEADMITRFEVIEIISAADGSAGWCTMLAGGHGGGPLGSSGLPQELVADPHGVMAGAVRPSGRATPCDGGYRVTGRWPFMSGSDHATWFSGACVVYDGDAPRIDENGRRVIVSCFFPREEAEIIDTWRATGLRGSASHDVSVEDVFVPYERSFGSIADFVSADEDAPLSPFIAVPGLLMVFHTPVVLGIARRALDTLVAMTENKIGARGTPMQREAQVQATVAQAEGLIGSARSYALEVLSDVLSTLERNEKPSFRQRALCRLSVSHAHKACVQAVDMLYDIGGGASAYEKNGMDRLLRDVRTANQHIVGDYKSFEFAGRMLMGMKPGEPMF